MKVKSINIKMTIIEVRKALTNPGFENHIRMGMLVGRMLGDEMVVEEVGVPQQTSNHTVTKIDSSSASQIGMSLLRQGRELIGSIKYSGQFSPEMSPIDRGWLEYQVSGKTVYLFLVTNSQDEYKAYVLTRDQGQLIIDEGVPVQFANISTGQEQEEKKEMDTKSINCKMRQEDIFQALTEGNHQDDVRLGIMMGTRLGQKVVVHKILVPKQECSPAFAEMDQASVVREIAYGISQGMIEVGIVKYVPLGRECAIFGPDEDIMKGDYTGTHLNAFLVINDCGKSEGYLYSSLGIADRLEIERGVSVGFVE